MQWPLPLDTELTEYDDESSIWDCDWEEQDCPTCGHSLEDHDMRTISRCANTSIHVPLSY